MPAAPEIQGLIRVVDTLEAQLGSIIKRCDEASADVARSKEQLAKDTAASQAFARGAALASRELVQSAHACRALVHASVVRVQRWNDAQGATNLIVAFTRQTDKLFAGISGRVHALEQRVSVLCTLSLCAARVVAARKREFTRHAAALRAYCAARQDLTHRITSCVDAHALAMRSYADTLSTRYGGVLSTIALEKTFRALTSENYRHRVQVEEEARRVQAAQAAHQQRLSRLQAALDADVAQLRKVEAEVRVAAPPRRRFDLFGGMFD
jgi:hypothetical protein